MKIGIDIDDTLTNTKENQIKYWHLFVDNHPTDEFTTDLPTNINEFGNAYIDKFWDTYREELSFNSKIKENASKAIKILQERGYDLVIITSRPKYKYHKLEERIKALLKANNIEITEIITDAKDKGISMAEHNIDVLIDDSIKHIESAIKHNKKVIHFNKQSNIEPHTTDWVKIPELIDKIK